MVSKVILFSNKNEELNNFLNKFYNNKLNLGNSNSWKKHFSNPVDITELIAAFVDNTNLAEITMWITLDEDVFIKVSPSNANNIIKYLFERYPY